MLSGMAPVSAQEKETPPAAPGGDKGQPGNTGAVTEWEAVNTYEDDATETGGTYESTGDEENAIHVSGGSVIFNQPTITRNSSTAQGGDTASFYGGGADNRRNVVHQWRRYYRVGNRYAGNADGHFETEYAGAYL